MKLYKIAAIAGIFILWTALIGSIPEKLRLQTTAMVLGIQINTILVTRKD